MADEESTDFGLKKILMRDKAGKVAQVFHSVVSKYDLMNDLMSLGSHRLMKQFAAELTSARKGHIILDLAGGTGDLTARLSPMVGKTGQVILCDINPSMLNKGRDRLIDKGLVRNVAFLQADAEKLPLPTDHFNAITIAFGLRNISRKEAALRSMLRILKPGGRLVILEFSKPQNKIVKSVYESFSAWWPKIGKKLTGDEESYQYLVDSIKMHPDQDTLKQMMLDSGFVKCDYHNIMNGIAAIHTGRKPRT